MLVYREIGRMIDSWGEVPDVACFRARQTITPAAESRLLVTRLHKPFPPGMHIMSVMLIVSV